MTVKVRAWSGASSDPLSFEAVQTMHLPAGHYRFTKSGYPGGAHFVGTLALPTVMYVLAGAIIYTIDGEEVSLKAGDVAEFDCCEYMCDVPVDVKLIKVIQLPEKLRK